MDRLRQSQFDSQGPILDVENGATSNDQSPKTEDFTGYGLSSKENEQKESNSEIKGHKTSEYAFYSSKEGLCRRESHSRPFRIERLHYLPNFQNAHLIRNKTDPSENVVYSSLRPERRFLACSNFQKTKSIPRIHLQRTRMDIQSHAIWPKCSPKNIHKTHKVYDKGPSSGRNLVPSISGRLADYCSNKRRMSSKGPQSNFSIRGSRMDYQFRKIPPRSSTSLRMVRNAIRSRQIQYTQHHQKYDYSTGASDSSDSVKLLYEETDNETPRPGQLDRSSKPIDTSYTLKYKDHTIEPFFGKPKFYSQTNNANEDEPHQVDSHSQCSTTFGYPQSNTPSPIRRVKDWLGFSDQSGPIHGEFRHFDAEVPHRDTGNPGSVVFNTDDSREQRSGSHSDGQYNCLSSSQETNVEKQDSCNSLRINLEKSYNSELDTDDSTHKWEIQCLGRPTVKGYNDLHRMVSSVQGFSENSQKTSPSSGGSICNETEQPITKLCVTVSRPECSRSERDEYRLEQVGSPLPLSSDPNDFEGFTETSGIKFQECNINNTRHSNTTVVYGPQTQTDTITCDEGLAETSSGEQAGIQSKSYQSSRLEVIKRAYTRQFPGCAQAVSLMAEPIKKTSANDYQRKWDTFIKYITKQKIPFQKVTINTVLLFLTHLFHEKNLRPSTVSHYRSALSLPMQQHFGIDLKVQAISSMLRSMRLQRPRNPVTAPNWKLNTVLEYIENTLDTSTTVNKLRKAAFLMLLATGWRISELHACVRNVEFCNFLENSRLSIRPHASFLAKNGLRNRLPTKEIKILRHKSGEISKICPVTALRDYLQCTPHSTEGCMFTDPNNSTKDLSINQLSYHVRSLIIKADPMTKVKVHDVRKYAASCSLAETMIVGDLVEALNWSSAATFYKYYFTQTDTLNGPVALPVSNS